MFSIDWAIEYIPFEYETAISQSINENIKNEINEVDKYLQFVANKIIPHMNLSDDINITVHYVNNDITNAMATLGGHIFIYRGLLEKLPHENSLLMLLGHEIGHIKLRHPVKALGKGVIMSLLLSVLLGESSDSVTNLISDTSMLTILSFSREQEQDSDDEGLKAINAFYGHTQGATTLFEILNKEYQNSALKIPQFLNSHPNTKNRIQHLNNTINEQGWVREGTETLIPENILKKLAEDRHGKNSLLNHNTK